MVDFLEKSPLRIDWETFQENSNVESAKEVLSKVIDNKFWQMNEEEILGKPTGNYHYHIEDYIGNLVQIIKFLNENNIPWSGGSTAFRGPYDNTGLLIINEKSIKVIDVDDHNITSEKSWKI